MCGARLLGRWAHPSQRLTFECTFVVWCRGTAWGSAGGRIFYLGAGSPGW
jgi:hypothetical protein